LTEGVLVRGPHARWTDITGKRCGKLVRHHAYTHCRLFHAKVHTRTDLLRVTLKTAEEKSWTLHYRLLFYAYSGWLSGVTVRTLDLDQKIVQNLLTHVQNIFVQYGMKFEWNGPFHEAQTVQNAWVYTTPCIGLFQADLSCLSPYCTYIRGHGADSMHATTLCDRHNGFLYRDPQS